MMEEKKNNYAKTPEWNKKISEGNRKYWADKKIFDSPEKGSIDRGRRFAQTHKRLNINVSPELHARIKQTAKDQDVSINDFITQMIERNLPHAKK